MKKHVSIWLLLLMMLCAIWTCTGSNGDDDDDNNDTPVDILTRLEQLEGVSVTEINPPNNFDGRAFRLEVTQFVDVNNPEAGTFSQLCYLSHRDEEEILVLNTRGYVTPYNYILELTDLLQSNQLMVTHRYFEDARPDPLDWQYLDIARAAADHHHITELFKQIYQGKWVNTGSSKGGMTAFFHRRFYPDDVDVTVSYVAPLMFGLEDPRFDSFLLDEVGDETCRQDIFEFQRTLLENRTEMIDRIEQLGLTFSIGSDVAFEYAVLEYLFFFWQYYRTGDCDSIPGPDATFDELFNQIRGIMQYYSDEGNEIYMPFWYQAMTELGYYRLITEHLEDLLVSVSDPTFAIFAPPGVDLTFDPNAMIDVDDWLKSFGNNMIFIYGSLDPYTATSVELTGQTNALKIIQTGASHGVRIAHLDERDLVISTLENWLETNITSPQTWIAEPNEHQLFETMITRKF